MALLSDLGRFWVRPRAVMRARLAALPSERVLLGWLIAALSIAFLLRLPGLVQLAEARGMPLAGLVGGAMVASLIFAPLFFYALAGGSQLVLWLATGRRGLGQGTRLALFFTLLSVQPLALLPLMAALAGLPAGIRQMVGWAVGLWAVLLWLAALREVVAGAPSGAPSGRGTDAAG